VVRSESVAVARPADALTLVSLDLRWRGEYYVWASADGRDTSKFNRGLFYWVGTRELLPAGWRWFSACIEHDAAVGSDNLTSLGGSVFQRVSRACSQRDALHRALSRLQDNDIAADALAALDSTSLMLSAALDATARVAHRRLRWS
jgi:hypothetical protein